MRLRAALLVGVTLLAAQVLAKPSPTLVSHAPWARKAVIYELNTRQFSPQGTFAGVLPHLEEIHDLGVDVVWFMPIHPIGVENRKGTKGSPYSISDYSVVNPEFGKLGDFKKLVDRIHQLGMHVIIDLVANHTAWDHPWTKSHPEWYQRDAQGHFVPPYPDWSDVIKLDYSQPGLRKAMISMMEYWVKDVGIDGFRCDVAGDVPTDFWEEARVQLDRIKPVFMLAEAEKPELVHAAFDCDYANEYFKILVKIAEHKAKLSELLDQVDMDREVYPVGGWRLQYTTNHDQNTWLDSDIHLFGAEGSLAYASLVFTLPGHPLIYNGQEVSNPKKLEFFERDPINWSGPSRRDFYKKWTRLYHGQPALSQGDLKPLSNDRADRVLSFQRGVGEGALVVVGNMSPKALNVTVQFEGPYEQERASLVSKSKLSPEGPLHLEPWEVEVYR